MRLRNRQIFLLLIFVILVSCSFLLGQDQADATSKTQPTKATSGAEALAVLNRFAILKNISGDEFLERAREGLWEIYPLGSDAKASLLHYVATAPDGPGLGFAAVALIPF